MNSSCPKQGWLYQNLCTHDYTNDIVACENPSNCSVFELKWSTHMAWQFTENQIHLDLKYYPFSSWLLLVLLHYFTLSDCYFDKSNFARGNNPSTPLLSNRSLIVKCFSVYALLEIKISLIDSKYREFHGIMLTKYVFICFGPESKYK